MANSYEAAVIKSTGNREYDPLGYGFAKRNHYLEMCIMNGLDYKEFAACKVMFFLTGNAENKFRVPAAEVAKRCNITEDTYYKTRTKLHKMGWITYDKVNKTITINYDVILKNSSENGSSSENLKSAESCLSSENCKELKSSSENCNSSMNGNSAQHSLSSSENCNDNQAENWYNNIRNMLKDNKINSTDYEMVPSEMKESLGGLKVKVQVGLEEWVECTIEYIF